MDIKTKADLLAIKKAYLEARDTRYHITVCGGGGCVSSGCLATRDAVAQFLEEKQLASEAGLTFTGCMGLCSLGPLMMIEPEGVLYVKVTPEMARDIIGRHIIVGEIAEEYTFYDEKRGKHIPHVRDIPFFSEQVKIALRNCGRVDYASLDSYIAQDGFQGL
ncbi:MAG TPA: NAD(P)H-dependent oxidoreductase subunit E, partial [Clostridia bacterium]|nr:NAD(P)H-dependent oxidoreductase subunit E [Clostridia bacterium]